MFGLSLILLVTTAAPGLSALNFKGYDWNTKAEKKVFSACDWVRSQLGQVERGLLPSQDDAILRPLRGLRRGRADKRDEQDHTQILFLLSYSEKWTVRTSPRPVIDDGGTQQFQRAVCLDSKYPDLVGVLSDQYQVTRNGNITFERMRSP
jgi:hypothetical protein